MEEEHVVRQGYMVVYTDQGPGGICGQSMSITCPHTYVWLYEDENAFREAFDAGGGKIGRKGRQQRVEHGPLDYGPMRLFDHRPAVAELAEARAERDRLHAALVMLSQCRHVSGSAQGAFRSNLAVVDAVLQGADVRDVDTVLAITDGTWKPNA